MAILQRGKDNAAIFQVLEGYLVTATPPLVAAMLNTHLPQVGASLLSCLNAVLQAAQKAHTGVPLPCPALPCTALTYFCISFPLLCLALPYPAVPCPALLRPALLSSTYAALLAPASTQQLCFAWLWPALPCPALPLLVSNRQRVSCNHRVRQAAFTGQVP